MPLHNRVKTALDEARTLILGAQILLGFQTVRGIGEDLAKGFESLELIKLAAVLQRSPDRGLRFATTSLRA